ncbi:unnamed protein product [Callosobruchus maculatus]|uniref:Uncharacterized protein n=1 Tax=Callosobruchus maculatus TaxID=64391 RepID=A0A653CZ69_CALMS|nr:unnamed protein product [Callosobruchus maculatus]
MNHTNSTSVLNHLMSKLYEQKFRDAWLKDPLLKNWLTTVQSTSGVLAKCKFCRVHLTSSILKPKKYQDMTWCQVG